MMTENISSSLLKDECQKNSEQNDITDIIEQVIKQVEHHNLDPPVDECSETSGLEISPIKNGNMNNSKSSDSTERTKHRSGNRKARIRSKRRKWKPYCKLTWNERKKLEERDTRRAFRFRERMSASGLTLAPYNTTQFLMEDHNLQEPDYESIHDSKNKEDSHSYDSEDFYSSPDDEEDFLQQQFSETYDSFHDAYINEMSKFDLVKELMRLEDSIEGVEQSLKESRDQKKLLSEKTELDVDAELAKIQVFQDEIEKLTRENIMLEQNNEILRNRLSVINSQ